MQVFVSIALKEEMVVPIPLDFGHLNTGVVGVKHLVGRPCLFYDEVLTRADPLNSNNTCLHYNIYHSGLTAPFFLFMPYSHSFFFPTES